MSRTVTVDLSEVFHLFKDMQVRLDSLNGRRIPGDVGGRERSAALAEISKELLFLGHLCDKARLASLDQYHSTRGYMPTSP